MYMIVQYIVARRTGWLGRFAQEVDKVRLVLHFVAESLTTLFMRSLKTIAKTPMQIKSFKRTTEKWNILISAFAYLNQWLVKPFLIVERREAISDDTRALVAPQGHEYFGRVADLAGNVEHALPDARQVSQVEDVVELGRRRQHLDFDALP